MWTETVHYKMYYINYYGSWVNTQWPNTHPLLVTFLTHWPTDAFPALSLSVFCSSPFHTLILFSFNFSKSNSLVLLRRTLSFSKNSPFQALGDSFIEWLADVVCDSNLTSSFKYLLYPGDPSASDTIGFSICCVVHD